MWDIIKLLVNTTVLAATLRMATPLLFTAVGGIFSERSGVVNIGLEGMMLIGAFTAVAVSYSTGSAWLGVLGALLAGALMGFIHGIASIKYRANQVVSGTAINIFAGGLTVYLQRLIFNMAGVSPAVPRIADVELPLISKIPLIGPVIGKQNPMVYLSLMIVVGAHIVILKTVWGLRIRSVGEHPGAADSVGINVYKTLVQ